MCDPMTAMAAGLQLVKANADIQSQNRASDANRANAVQAGNDAYKQESLSFVEQNRSLIQGGFDAVLAGRAAEAEAYTSAIESGVSGASIKAMLRDSRQRATRSANRAGQEIASLGQQAAVNLQHIRSTTLGRINQVPRTKFGIGDAAGVLAPIVQSQME